MFAATLLAAAWGPMVGQAAAHPVQKHHSSRMGCGWRQKLKHTSTTVAAMKRAARKNRNRSKRNG